jgi:hypothetical protein
MFRLLSLAACTATTACAASSLLVAGAFFVLGLWPCARAFGRQCYRVPRAHPMCGEPLAPQIHCPRQSLEIGLTGVPTPCAGSTAQLWEIERLQLSWKVGPLSVYPEFCNVFV